MDKEGEREMQDRKVMWSKFPRKPSSSSVNGSQRRLAEWSTAEKFCSNRVYEKRQNGAKRKFINDATPTRIRRWRRFKRRPNVDRRASNRKNNRNCFCFFVRSKYRLARWVLRNDVSRSKKSTSSNCDSWFLGLTDKPLRRYHCFFKKWAFPASFSFIFVFSNKHNNFYNKCGKMYIQYTVPGFELTTFWIWVSSHNH